MDLPHKEQGNNAMFSPRAGETEGGNFPIREGRGFVSVTLTPTTRMVICERKEIRQRDCREKGEQF